MQIIINDQIMFDGSESSGGSGGGGASSIEWATRASVISQASRHRGIYGKLEPFEVPVKVKWKFLDGVSFFLVWFL